MNKDIIFEAVKEPLRLLILALITLAIKYFADLDWQYASAVLVGLRLADSLLHEMGKVRSTKDNESVLLRGLTRF